jgi:prepilin-type processing-associated H-X9-DG protein
VTRGWVDLDYGYADLSATTGGYTNEMTITQGLLWGYASSQGVYRCPDQNQVYNFAGSGDLLTAVPARSYSVSSRMNGGLDGPYLTVSGILAPPPAQAFVFIDENLYTIEEGRFIVNPSNPVMWGDNSAVVSLDVPAARHGGLGALSFADGHSELHSWLEPSTALVNGSAIQGFNFPSFPGAGGGANKDILWVQARYLTTVTN